MGDAATQIGRILEMDPCSDPSCRPGWSPPWLWAGLARPGAGPGQAGEDRHDQHPVGPGAVTSGQDIRDGFLLAAADGTLGGGSGAGFWSRTMR